MASSKTGIVNLALSHLGAGKIDNFDEGGEPARLARTSYLEHRDSLMREYFWGFTKTRASATAESTPPKWGWDQAYAVPGDYLRIIAIEGDNDTTLNWAIERVNDKTCIVCNVVSPIKFVYVAKIEDVHSYDVCFVQALSAKLAYEWAIPLGKNQKYLADMARLFDAKLLTAETMNALEKTPEQISADSWDNARRHSALRIAVGDSQPY